MRLQGKARASRRRQVVLGDPACLRYHFAGFPHVNVGHNLIDWADQRFKFHFAATTSPAIQFNRAYTPHEALDDFSWFGVAVDKRYLLDRTTDVSEPHAVTTAIQRTTEEVRAVPVDPDVSTRRCLAHAHGGGRLHGQRCGHP